MDRQLADTQRLQSVLAMQQLYTWHRSGAGSSHAPLLTAWFNASQRAVVSFTTSAAQQGLSVGCMQSVALICGWCRQLPLQPVLWSCYRGPRCDSSACQLLEQQALAVMGWAGMHAKVSSVGSADFVQMQQGELSCIAAARRAVDSALRRVSAIAAVHGVEALPDWTRVETNCDAVCCMLSATLCLIV
jgi:hypothetical protein